MKVLKILVSRFGGDDIETLTTVLFVKDLSRAGRDLQFDMHAMEYCL